MHFPSSFRRFPRARACSLLACAVVLAACSSAARVAPLPSSPLLGKPVSFNKPGPLQHAATGFEFAESYGAFKRVSARRYDAAGLNVGVGYDDRQPDCTIVTLFYVYPTPESASAPVSTESSEQSWLDDEFSTARRYVQYNNPGMLLPELSMTSTPTADGSLPGMQLAFRDASSFSELRLFVYSKRWFLKYRFTYPETCETEASRRIAALIAQMPWNHEGS